MLKREKITTSKSEEPKDSVIKKEEKPMKTLVGKAINGKAERQKHEIKEDIGKKGTQKNKTKEDIKGAKVGPIKKIKPAVYFAVGRRKTAIARVRLYTGLPKEENKIFVNDKPIEEYFPGEIAKKAYIEPFRTTNTIGRFKVTVKVKGSGRNGQLGACILGFARAIEQVDKAKFRPILKKRGLLTRDARVKERRKAGTGGKARRKKQSPKR